MTTFEIVLSCGLILAMIVLFLSARTSHRKMKKLDEDFAKVQRQIDALPRMTPEEKRELMQAEPNEQIDSASR